jgi:adenosine deaminase
MHSATEKPEEASNLRNRLCALPKVDLHRHLEGSLRLQTLAEIAQEHGIDLPSYDIEVLRPFVTAADEEPDFHRFLEKFRFLRRFYPTQEAVERIAYEAVADAAEDNVRYLELRFNPIAQARGQGFSLDEVTTWICGAVDKAQREIDIRVNLIVQIGRDESLDTAWQVAEVAVAHRHRGVVGLDLAGDEVRYPARGFAEVFQWARREGLHITVHAGEAAGARSVQEAIELLGAQRIGHGIRTVEDSDVVRLVHERGVTLEVCPTSNLQTGVVRRLGQHPLIDLLALGLRATVNTDDPSVSDTTLTDEYEVAMLAMGLTLGHIKRAIVTAAEGSFQPPEEKEQMVEWFREALESENGSLSGLTSREVNDSVNSRSDRSPDC